MFEDHDYDGESGSEVMDASDEEFSEGNQHDEVNGAQGQNGEEVDATQSNKSSRKNKKTKLKHLKNVLNGTSTNSEGSQLSSKVINQLTETECLSQSNLYRIQINELLAETQVKPKSRAKLENWLQEFQHVWLTTVKHIEGIPIKPLKKLKQKLNIIQLPLPIRLQAKQKGSKLGLFKWIPPSVIIPIGSWATNSAVSKLSSFDVAVEIPKECLSHGDYINHKYHIKRAIYMSYLGQQLLARGDNVKFICPDGNLLKPVLEITLPSATGKRTSKSFLKIRLHFIPPSDFFKPKHFDSVRNNIRFKYFFKTDVQNDDDPSFSTPVYSQTILGDALVLRNHEMLKNVLSSSTGVTNTNNICEAIKLLKIWLQRRHFNQGYGAFSNYIMTMFVTYLLLQKKISNSMNSYQIIRVVFVNLINSDWLTKGISLTTTSGVPDENLSHWFLQFDVVFLDFTGSLNLTSCMSKYTYSRVKMEAQLALNILNSCDVSGFQFMFIKDVPFCLSYDHILQIKVTPELISQFENDDEFKPSLLSTSGYFLPVGVSVIGQLIEKCLKKRIQLLNFEIPSPPAWAVSRKRLPPVFNGFMTLNFGLVINRSTAFKLVEKCESEDAIELESFKEFWGEKSQLRRFRDGTIVEAVSYETDKDNANNHVCFNMLQYILKKHLNLNITEQEVELEKHVPVGYYIDKQVENLIEPMFEMIKSETSPGNTKIEPKSTISVKIKNENQSAKESPPAKRKKSDTNQMKQETVKTNVDEITKLACASLDSLSKILRDLDDLPLSITSVQGTSPILRYTNIYPTPPQVFYSSNVLTTRQSNSLHCLHIMESSTNSIKKVPKYNEAIDVIVQLEGSGKWPDNIQAIQRLKAAFLLRIAQLLQSKFGLTIQVFPSHLYVLKDGFIFSIRLTYYRELILMKQLQGADGIVRLRDNVESFQQEKSTLLLPKLTSTLASFNAQYTAFGKTCRLAKRWVASHLLLASKFHPLSDLKQPDYCVPEEAIELLVASLFLNSSPYLKPPNEAQVGFLRFLTLLSDTDWNSIAIIINFNDLLTKDEISSIESEFTKRRSTLPTPFISYPDDQLNSVWTKNILPIVWKRLVQLGKTALSVILTHFQNNCASTSVNPTIPPLDPFRTIFKTDLSQFDILIWIKRSMNGKRSINTSSLNNGVGENDCSSNIIQFKEYVKQRDELIPITNFDPVQSFLLELRQNFGHFGLFLLDTYDETLIAFVWKPDALNEHEFKISTVKGQVLKSNAEVSNYNIGEAVVEPNVDGLIELFHVLGNGIIDKVVRKKDFDINGHGPGDEDSIDE